MVLHSVINMKSDRNSRVKNEKNLREAFLSKHQKDVGWAGEEASDAV